MQSVIPVHHQRHCSPVHRAYLLQFLVQKGHWYRQHWVALYRGANSTKGMVFWDQKPCFETKYYFLLAGMEFESDQTTVRSCQRFFLPTEKRKEWKLNLLANQLIKPVKYKQSILANNKVDTFIEFGNGIVLKGLNRKIVKSIPTLNVSDLASLEKTIEALND